tara:strand:- start:1622 stop:2875 length:1254 start_codon:yes stop_codon:yes gene_type:complete
MVYTADGSNDYTFGSDGRLNIKAYWPTFYPATLLASPGAKITVPGLYSGLPYLGIESIVPGVARLEANGDPDLSFSDDGLAVAVFQSSRATPGATLADGIVLPDGAIVVTGDYEGDFALARFRASGNFDIVDELVPLVSGVSALPFLSAESSVRKFYIDVPNGAERLTVSTATEYGRFQLLVRFDSQPGFESYDCVLEGLGQYSGSCEIPAPPAGRHFVTMEAIDSISVQSLTAKFFLSPPVTGKLPGGTWVTASGEVVTAEGQPLCGMVLVNGQYVFSCSPTGSFNLRFPLDQYGLATMFVFVDERTPIRIALAPDETSIEREVRVGRAYDIQSPNIEIVETTVTTGNRAVVRGRIRDDGGTPLCGIVLANGAYMFSCGGFGLFELDVPLDPNGEITVFAFVDSMAPAKVIYAPAP